MKIPSPIRLTALKACFLPLAFATLVAVAPSGYSQTSTSARSANQYEQLAPEAVDELVAPFALYPDALIALILPASTVPSDVTLASRYLGNGGTDFENQSWDDSVISLARYPEVVTWMDENLAWTTAVGSAFLAQPVDVMNSLQRLRAAAAAAGNLDTTPQQRVVREVVEETTYIRIIPAQPDVIYVPVYDPVVVYYPQPNYVGNIISFGAGFALGSWLNYDCDWGRRGIYRGDYNPGWNNYYGGGGRGGDQTVIQNNTEVNVTNITNNSANLWQPDNNSRNQLERRKDNYNQRVRAANQEVRAARRDADGNPIRAGRPIEALPQPEPMVVDGKRGRKQDNLTAGDPLTETNRKRNKRANAESQNGVAPETAHPITDPADAPNRKRKSQEQLPTDAPVESPSTAVNTKPGKNKAPRGENALPNANQPDNAKATETTQQPAAAPNEKRLQKKADRAATQPNSNKQKRGPAGERPTTLQPSTAPTVPGSVNAPQSQTRNKKSRATETAPQSGKADRPSTPAQPQNQKAQDRQVRKQEKRQAPPAQTAPTQKQKQKADRPRPSAQPQQQPQQQKAPERQERKQEKRQAPQSQTAPTQKQNRKADRPRPSAQQQQQQQQQKAPDRQVRKQEKRQAPQSQAQPRRENKSDRKQQQAAQSKPAQSNPAQTSGNGGARENKKDKKDKKDNDN